MEVTAVHQNRHRIITYPIIGIVVLFVALYLLFITFANEMSALNNLYQNNTFLQGIFSQILFTVALGSILLAIISLRLINKNNWAKVKGKILKVNVLNKYTQNSLVAYVKTEYTYSFKNRQYFKKSHYKIRFDNKTEYKEFIENGSSNEMKFVDLYVYKRMPNISSETKKVNFLMLAISLLMVLASAFFILFGLLFQAIEKGFLEIVVESVPNGTNTYIKELKPLTDYTSTFDSLTILILGLTIIVAVLFILQASRLVVHNKTFFGTPEIESQTLKEGQKQGIDQKYCSECNSLNDYDSEYCFNCGAKLN